MTSPRLNKSDDLALDEADDPVLLVGQVRVRSEDPRALNLETNGFDLKMGLAF